MAVNWPLHVGYASVTWRLHGGYTAALLALWLAQVRKDGEIVIFEINTRMGADLGCDVPASMLRELMRTLDDLERAES